MQDTPVQCRVRLARVGNGQVKVGYTFISSAFIMCAFLLPSAADKSNWDPKACVQGVFGEVLRFSSSS